VARSCEYVNELSGSKNNVLPGQLLNDLSLSGKLLNYEVGLNVKNVTVGSPRTKKILYTYFIRRL
jgi:hypothetical protein